MNPFRRISSIAGENPGVCILICLTVIAQTIRADALSGDNGKDKVAAAVKMKVQAFPLEEVRLLDGPFKRAIDLDGQYLLSLEADRLVHNFRVNAGISSSAQPLGGWEAPECELRGHFVGHYMSACAQMYAATGDTRFKDKGRAVVQALAQCQDRLGGGYLSAFPESFIDRVEKRVQVWAPYYTLHKIFAGLEDMYVYCDDAQALQMAEKFGDWAIARNSRLTDAQMQAMLGTEQGGMNETLANLYALTGEKKYLEISLRFNHHRVLDPAERGEDRLTGLHANTQFPKFIGLARQYELTGDAQSAQGVRFFWDTVVSNRSYVIGGNSDGEVFTATNHLSRMGPITTETCNTYNMLKLTRHLFCWNPQAAYADYYDRALCNHILSSQDPETGMMCYYVPLRTGSRKKYNSPTRDFWCCTGTGVENHGKYGDSIYFHNDRQLYVNLFIGSELNWKEKAIKVRQESRYPEEQRSSLTVSCQKPLELEIDLRHPAWASNGFKILVNGRPQEPGAPGSYVAIKRRWRDGDQIEIKMPFAVRLEGFKDRPERVAVMDGPLVMAAVIDTNKPNPGIVGQPSQFLAALKPAAPQSEVLRAAPGIFRIPGETRATSVRLLPFYTIHAQRTYEVYWDEFTPDQWATKEKDYAAQLERRKETNGRGAASVKPDNGQ